MRILVSKVRDEAFVPSAAVEVAPHITTICERCGEEMEPSEFSQDNPETVSFKNDVPEVRPVVLRDAELPSAAARKAAVTHFSFGEKPCRRTR